MKLVLPVLLQDQIAREAMTAYPRECCGLIAGVAQADGFRAAALYPARNLAASPDRFEIAPADHISALKAARLDGHVLIGCYHSHPDGRALPSTSDSHGATQTDFLWLIAATDGAQCRLAGFVYRGGNFAEVVVSAVGADLVTSSLKDLS
jgi:proteasome lid subunit RPN8/RPN11